MSRNQRIRTLGLAIVLALASTGAAAVSDVTDPDQPRRLQPEGPVVVSWEDPAGFSEIRHSRNRFEAKRGDWVRGIARHVARQAGGALQPGERLEVHVTDIELAGEYEPAAGRTDHVRIVRDIYPPRIDLRYTRFDASGTVVDSGERTLRDLGFLTHAGYGPLRDDPLRHEKRLVDDWVRKDIAGSGRVAGGG